MTDTAPAIDAILSEHADLERQLSDPNLHSDAGKARKVGRRFAQLAPIVATYRKLEAARGDLGRRPRTGRRRRVLRRRSRRTLRNGRTNSTPI